MKKVLLALILAGGTIFAANARGVVIGLPGFYLNVGGSGCPVVVAPPVAPAPVYVVPPVPRYYRPILPPPRYHRPILPPVRHHRHHGRHHRR